MRIVGYVALGIVALMVAGAIVAAVGSAGDIRRYLRIRRM
jgi:hypothetical protein